MRSRNQAVVFAGIGSARLASALLDPVLRASGGRRVKQIGGTLLYIFDLPSAAVHCAGALLERARREGVLPQLRVGVQLGDVRLAQGDIFGDPVNLASRIESSCGPGEVLLGEAVWLSMPHEGVQVEDLGTRTMKGVPEAIRLFKLVSVTGAEELVDRLELEPPHWRERVSIFIGAGLAAMLLFAALFRWVRS